MSEARFTVEPNDTLRAFELGAFEETYFPGEITRGTDNLDYRFVNGFTDVGDLPCRVALLKDIATRQDPLPEPFEQSAMHLPGFNRRLEFSGFWHRPTRLVRWARTRVFCDTPGPHKLRIATPGGVFLWMDGEPVFGFEPFTRNSAQSTTTEITIKPEGSELLIRLEELAERDTNFFVELQWLGEVPLVTSIPGGADAANLLALTELARSVRPCDVFFDGSGPLTLEFDRPAPVDVTVRARVSQSVHLAHRPPLLAATGCLSRGTDRVDIAALDDLPDGYHPLHLELEIGETRIERTIGFALLRELRPETLPVDPAERRLTALHHAARYGESRPGRTLARLHLGLDLDATDLEILDDTLDGIEGRRDCCDFVMVPLLWIRGDHGDVLPEPLRDRIDAAILGWRYWVDEPGNDAMWFWSENHALCFHVSQYIAGGLFPDAQFSNAGMSGREHRVQADERLAKWFDSVEAHGLAEWNSAAYYPIDAIGLAALVRWGEGKLKARATEALDRLHAMVALHSSGGVPVGSMGRAYDKELRAGPLTELAPIQAMAFGTGWLNSGVAALPLLAVAGYAPPEEYCRWANPRPDTNFEAHYVQGYGPAARLGLWKTAHVQLSASIDQTPGAKGHQQHMVDVQSAHHPFARVWINHPGEDDPWGEQRPSYWAGNGVMPRVGMSRNRCLLSYDLGPKPRLPWTHAYAPLSVFDSDFRGADWLVLQSGKAFVLIKATGVIRSVETGPGAGIEHRLDGARSGWAIVVGDLPVGGLEVIAERARRMRLGYLAGTQTLELTETGEPRLSLSWADGLFLDGSPQPFPNAMIIPRVTPHTSFGEDADA